MGRERYYGRREKGIDLRKDIKTKEKVEKGKK